MTYFIDDIGKCFKAVKAESEALRGVKMASNRKFQKVVFETYSEQVCFNGKRK